MNNTNEPWIKETLGLLDELQKRKTTIEAEIGELEEELEELHEKITAGHSLIRAYIEKHNLPSLPLDIDPHILTNMSYPQMVIEIAKARQGYLKVSDAVETILKAEAGYDKRTVQANVYSAIGRLSKRFVKIKPGEYRFTNHIQESTSSEPSGIRQAVKELKEKNPQMTKKEVLNYLIKSGFDFKGKKPSNAVNITWAYLGYSKEGKQQTLSPNFT